MQSARVRFMVIFVVTALSKACVAVLHDKRLRAIQKEGGHLSFLHHCEHKKWHNFHECGRIREKKARCGV